MFLIRYKKSNVKLWGAYSNRWLDDDEEAGATLYTAEAIGKVKLPKYGEWVHYKNL